MVRQRVHRLIDQLSNEELVDLWAVLADAYCDLYMLRATQASRRVVSPGDTLTLEEAMRFLSLL